MSNAILESEIEAAWNIRDTITPSTKGKVRDAIEETLEALDKGELRVAEKTENNVWKVNQWAKKLFSLGSELKIWKSKMAVPSLQVGGIKWTVNLKTGLKNHGKKRVLEQFLIVWLGSQHT